MAILARGHAKNEPYASRFGDGFEVSSSTSTFSDDQNTNDDEVSDQDCHKVNSQTSQDQALTPLPLAYRRRSRCRSRHASTDLERDRSRFLSFSEIVHGHHGYEVHSLADHSSPRKRKRPLSFDFTSLRLEQGQQHKRLDLYGSMNRGTSLTNQITQHWDYEARMPKLEETHFCQPSEYSLSLLESGQYIYQDGSSPLALKSFNQSRYLPQPQSGRLLRNVSILRRMSMVIGSTVLSAVDKVVAHPRRTSILQTYEKAKVRQKHLYRSKFVMLLFQYSIYIMFVTFIYLVLVGRPIWLGTYWYVYVLFEYDMAFVGGSAIFLGLAFFYAFAPLLVSFQKPAPIPFHRPTFARALDTALLIPCHKSASILPATLVAALAIFPVCNIFVIANGNSPNPIDNTEEICRRFGVAHVWSPIGSKIVAQYVGTYVAKGFPYVLLIDDDCALPRNFPVATERIKDKIKVVGYTIKSVGPGSSRGNYCQQAQDVEYKLSGLQRHFAGVIGSATFPHGAISLWDRRFLAKTFQEHPGFSISEDWFFGHVARTLGSRCVMCSSVFVETETPASVFFSSTASRGGFGETTVFKQRFERWNFFFVNGIYYNARYLLFSWKLGGWEIGAKIFVFQEVYETLLYLVTPLVLPISFLVRPYYTLYLFLGTYCMYLLNSLIFNEIHLHRANEQVDRLMLVTYYIFYKFILTFINVASTWWSIWKYAEYFAKRHPKIVEDHRAVGLVLQIEEEEYQRNSMSKKSIENSDSTERQHSGHHPRLDHATRNGSYEQSRRLTVTAFQVDAVPVTEPNLSMSGGYDKIAVVDKTSPDAIDSKSAATMPCLESQSPGAGSAGSHLQCETSGKNDVGSLETILTSGSLKRNRQQFENAFKDLAHLDAVRESLELDTTIAL